MPNRNKRQWGVPVVPAETAVNRLVPGCLLETARPGTFLTRGITSFQSFLSGQVTVFNHSMRYVGEGMVHSQENTYRELPLSKWKGVLIRAWNNPNYTQEQINLLIEESSIRLGTWYDYPGILGQVLRPIPYIGKKLSTKLDFPFLNFCSEGFCEVERKVNPGFCGSGECQLNPDELDTWCLLHDWRRFTFVVS